MLNIKEIESLYNQIPAACIILLADKPHFRIATMNTAFVNVTGRAREDLIGQNFFDAFPQDLHQQGSIPDAFDHVLESKTPCVVSRNRYDLSSYEGPARKRYWDLNIYPLLDEGGDVRYIVHSPTEITSLVEAEEKLEANNARLIRELEERTTVEEALQLSNERYRYVNMATNDAIYDWDIEQDHIAWGEAFFNAYGCDRDRAFPLERWAALVHRDDYEEVRRSLEEALANSELHNWKAEYRLRRKTGIYADIEENGYILRGASGNAKRLIGVLRDVSDYKKAEAELQALKDTFTDLFQLNPLPMWVYDFNTLMFLDVNEAAVAHYGYSKEDFLSMSLKDIRPAEDEQVFYEVLHQVNSASAHQACVRHLKKSGEVIYVNSTGNTIRYGSSEARIVVAIDITEKRRFEKALLNSERRFKTLIQEGSDLIAIVDVNGNYKYVSPTVERLLHVDPEKLVGEYAFKYIHAGDISTVYQELQSLATEKCVKLTPYRLINEQGEIHWMETIVTDMRDDDAVGGIVCNARVVTERMEQELRIQEHLDRLNAVSKATSDSIWDLDFVSGRVLWNHGITATFGYEELEVNYQWWYDRVHPEDINRVTQVVKEHVEQKKSRWTSEYRFRCADGDYKYVLDRGFLIFDEKTGKVLRMIGAFQDISERVAYTNAVEEHNRRLKEIAWTQAHTVRGPLTSILGLLPLLNEKDIDDDTRKSIMCHLENATKKLDEVIREIISRSQNAVRKR